MKDYDGQCADVPADGRSVRITCEKKPESVKEVTVKTVQAPSTTSVQRNQTVTVTHHHIAPKETVKPITHTMVPQERKWRLCPYDDDE